MIGEYADTNSHGRTHGHLDDRVIQYMLDLARIAEQASLPLQFFILGETLERPAEYLRDLARRGHALDQHTYSHLSLLSEERVQTECGIARTCDLFQDVLGFRPVGLRGPGGYRNGLQDAAEVQQIVLQAGLQFVSSHYATKAPSGKYDLFADKNAYMMLKHLQPRRYDSGLLEVPIMGYSDRHWFDNQGRDLGGWIRHLQDCIDFAYDMGGLVYAPGLHPDTHSRHDPGLQTLPSLIEHAGRKHEPVRFVTYREVAEAVSAK